MKLAQLLNRTVLVSIPAFFGDDETRACMLVDVEGTGLWLACEELMDRIEPAREISAAWNAPVTGFFPFTQILFVVDPSQFAVLARRPHRPPPPTSPTQNAPKKPGRRHAHREERPKHKDAKRRR
jgi:hypothetical protein